MLSSAILFVLVRKDDGACLSDQASIHYLLNFGLEDGAMQ
jgi:hypothetical protein